MATIGMLYICTGKYTVFWPEFYETFSRNFLPGCKKEYFILNNGRFFFPSHKRKP